MAHDHDHGHHHASAQTALEPRFNVLDGRLYFPNKKALDAHFNPDWRTRLHQGKKPSLSILFGEEAKVMRFAPTIDRKTGEQRVISNGDPLSGVEYYFSIKKAELPARYKVFLEDELGDRLRRWSIPGTMPRRQHDIEIKQCFSLVAGIEVKNGNSFEVSLHIDRLKDKTLRVSEVTFNRLKNPVNFEGGMQLLALELAGDIARHVVRRKGNLTPPETIHPGKPEELVEKAFDYYENIISIETLNAANEDVMRYVDQSCVHQIVKPRRPGLRFF